MDAGGAGWSAAQAVKLRNKIGQTPLHCAAFAGCWASAALLYNAAPEVTLWRDRRDLTPAACAARRGHAVSDAPSPTALYLQLRLLWLRSDNVS